MIDSPLKCFQRENSGRESDVFEIVISLISGLLVGGFFGAVGAAVPAPPNVAGVLGIVGITLGYAFMNFLKAH
jgi:hypothetical protein